MATMLKVNSLQPPKTGTSRWSKALPDVPGPDDPDFYDDYDDASPRLPPAKEFPLPPPRSTSMANAKPLPRSLPPLQLLAPDAPPSGPPKMAIPRRPVGKHPVFPPPQQQQQQQVASPPSPPSPSESLSSILSAYSRSSGESLVRSSDGANTSTRESAANPSPSREAPLVSTKASTFMSPSTNLKNTTQIQAQLSQEQQQQQQQHVAPKPFIDNPRPPPLPSKDTKYHLPATPAPNRAAASKNKVSDVNSSPSQTQHHQPQLWRRRSNKAERSLELPDLKLVSSHGSTAATTAAPPRPVQQQQQLPPPPPGALKVSTLSYPSPRGTNASAPSDQSADIQAMGSNSSKLNRLKDRLHFHRRGKSSSDTSKTSTPRPGTQRPPTPEYQKEDIKTPIVDAFVSPLSPASSPEPAAEVSPELPRETPSESFQQRTRAPSSAGAAGIEANNIVRKALPPPKLPSPAEPRLLSEPSTKSESPVSGSLPPLVTDLPGNRGSAGSDSGSGRTQHAPEGPSRFPPRHSSVRSNAPPRQLATDQDPRLVQSESQGLLYKGRDGTLYPEMKVLREPDPRAAYFPRQGDLPTLDGTIIMAPPLKQSHFNCYQEHKTMNRRPNRHYPLTCQTCERSDAEDRWTCSFCHLRICESCQKQLNNNEKDLRRLIDELRQIS
ncbi:hypothetical protein ACJ41O_004215 [Fusarium nematophilum]